MATAFLFPGQGSQTVGMGKALAEAFPQARDVFAELDDTLSQKLSSLIFEGPESELTLTINAQPALMAMSIAVLRVLEAETDLDLAREAKFVAGHSLGEYSALAAASALSFADTARLLRLRGKAMQEAVPVGAGAMAVILGLDFDESAAVAAMAVNDLRPAGAVCQAANDNGGGQVVISGTKAAVERAMTIARTRGARRAMLLPVSAPFHCALMQPAADAMAEALANVVIRPARVPVVANVAAAAITDPSEIRRRLVEQVTGAVRWQESIVYMADRGVEMFYELGAGKVLSSLVKRSAGKAGGAAIGTPADVEAFRSRRRG